MGFLASSDISDRRLILEENAYLDYLSCVVGVVNRGIFTSYRL